MVLSQTLVCLNFLYFVEVTSYLVTFPLNPLSPRPVSPGQYEHSGRRLPLAQSHRGQQDRGGGRLLLSQQF